MSLRRRPVLSCLCLREINEHFQLSQACPVSLPPARLSRAQDAGGGLGAAKCLPSQAPSLHRLWPRLSKASHRCILACIMGSQGIRWGYITSEYWQQQNALGAGRGLTHRLPREGPPFSQQPLWVSHLISTSFYLKYICVCGVPGWLSWLGDRLRFR